MHENVADDHWWRGCKPNHDEPLGCSEHNFPHDGYDVLVDECVCDTDMCNTEMGPIPTVTSTTTTTTPQGMLILFPN